MPSSISNRMFLEFKSGSSSADLNLQSKHSCINLQSTHTKLQLIISDEECLVCSRNFFNVHILVGCK